MMRIATLRFGTALTLTCTSSLAAQEDFRAADADRPIRVEDAYPLKLYEWEWQLGSRSAIADGGRYELAQLFELKTGIARNVQLGIELHGSQQRAAGAWSTGLEEFSAHLFYNLNQESRSTPAFAVRVDAFGPGIGDVGREDIGVRLRGILTRSLGRLRLHANGGYDWATVADGADFWHGGLAFDYPIGLFSKALLGDVYAEFPAGSGDARIWAELGTRFQLTNSTVLDFGITSRVDEWTDGAPNIGLVIGLSRVFGIAGLTPVPAYPNPRID